MSYLTLRPNEPAVQGFTKAIISFWYRMPGSTTAAKIKTDNITEFNGTIPLVVIGDPLKQREFLFKDRLHGGPIITTGPNFGASGEVLAGYWAISGWITTLGKSSYSDPSYISVTDDGDLVVKLNFDGDPRVQNYAFDPAGVVEEDVGELRFYTPAGHTDVSATNLLQGKRESYELTPTIPNTRPKKNHWHHVLLSFDLGTVRITSQPSGSPSTFKPAFGSYSKMWCSVDDVPVNLLNDQRHRLTGQPTDAIISDAQTNVATVPYDPDVTNMTFVLEGIDRPLDPITGVPYGSREIGIGSYTIEPGLVPTYSFSPSVKCKTIGIPAHTRFETSVRHVEMAEFEMWTGQSVNVREKDIRRLFITDKGKPNLKRKDRADKFGEPQIELHKRGNWIKGKNTGTDEDQFTPTGKIKGYTPNPSLDGKQGDPQ